MRSSDLRTNRTFAHRTIFRLVGAAAVAGSSALVPIFLTGCATSATPNPKAFADTFAEAAKRGDDDALYGMMTTTARETYSKDDVRKLVREQREELRERGTDLQAAGTSVRAFARLRYDDGEEVQLDLYGGRFWITAAGSMPGGSRSPEAALDQFRRVLARRSYAGLMRVLSPSTRAAIEQDLRSLVEGLEHPETLRVKPLGDVANVQVPGGHTVKLKRDNGIWRVEDFD